MQKIQYFLIIKFLMCIIMRIQRTLDVDPPQHSIITQPRIPAYTVTQADMRLQYRTEMSEDS